MTNIYCVTNRKLCKNFYHRVEEIAKNNVDFIIIREKDLKGNEIYKLSKKVKYIGEKYGTRIIINSNVEIYKKLNLYGIQLSFKDFKEKHINIKGIKGVSIHSYTEAVEAEKLGADYIIYGHIFHTKCKEGIEPRGLNELKKITKDIKIPVIAIGGINDSNFKQVLECNVYGIALMSSLMELKDIDKYIRKFNI